jgi:hypothetical protein
MKVRRCFSGYVISQYGHKMKLGVYSTRDRGTGCRRPEDFIFAVVGGRKARGKDTTRKTET